LYTTNAASVATTNILPGNAPVTLTSPTAVLDLEAVNQTLPAVSGPAGSAILLGYNSKLTLTSGGEFDGNITGNGSITELNTGILMFGGANIAYTGATTLGFGATLKLLPSNTTGIVIRKIGALTIGSSAQLDLAPAIAQTSRQLLVIPSLSNSGLIDLADNDLLVQGAGSTGLATLTNQIALGYHIGTWQGSTGITSSMAAASANHLTALGVIQNDNGAGTALYAAFDGAPAVDADVFAKYTYYGDANLDGKVDGSDYARIDSGYLTAATGWFNGDFNYDGVVDGSDYTLIDNAFNSQGAALTSQIAVATTQIATAAASVPEPAMSGIFVGVAVAMLRRRRSASSPSQQLERYLPLTGNL
jgi:hypothetical protein